MADSRPFVGGIVLAMISLGISPVVIRKNGRAIAVIQFKDGIAQRFRNWWIASCKGGANCSHNNARAAHAVASNDEASDRHIRAGVNETAGADIGELRISRLIKIMRFDHATKPDELIRPNADLERAFDRLSIWPRLGPGSLIPAPHQGRFAKRGLKAAGVRLLSLRWGKALSSTPGMKSMP